ILGGPNDIEIGNQISKSLSDHPNFKFENLCGQLKMKESILAIANSSHYIGIDSGLLHFARLLGIPTTSYWGPTNPSTLLRPFLDIKETVYYKKIPCSPCTHITEFPPCNGNNLCIQNIFKETKGDLEWIGVIN
ncbi:MAG: hypothetical protein KDD25_06485, partial [Bdellovibrionales bacterium]|nr:hypothetical protein [Bdellovibrionales bacterium]